MDKIYGILGIATKAGKIISGFDSIKDNIEKKSVELIVVANETSDKTKKEIKFICDKHNIKHVVFGSIEGNSHAIGKRNRAIIGITDKGLSEKFLELIKEEKKT